MRGRWAGAWRRMLCMVPLVLVAACGRTTPLSAPTQVVATPSASIMASASQSSPKAPGSPTSSGPAIGGIAFFDAREGLLVGGTSGSGTLQPGGSGIVWRTEDDGVVWTKTELGTPSLWSAAVVGPSLAWAGAVCGSDAPAGCRSALLRSTDGGRTWSTISNEAFAALSFVDPATGFGIGPIRPGAGPAGSPLRRTTDGGRTWSTVPAQPCPASPVMWPIGVSFTDPSDGWVACGGVGGGGSSQKAVVRTIDGGRSWTIVASAYPLGGVTTPDVGSIPAADVLWGIAMGSDGHGLIWMPLGAVDGTWQTADAGRTWTDLRFGATPGADGAIAGWLLDDRTWFLVLEEADGVVGIVESGDGGTSWRMLATPS